MEKKEDPADSKLMAKLGELKLADDVASSFPTGKENGSAAAVTTIAQNTPDL